MITEQFIDSIYKRLDEGKTIRRTLPLNGRIHIDRPLPFICIYRKSSKIKDEGIEKLVKGEASYLITSSSSKLQKGITALLESIIEKLSSDFGSFLVIEIWMTRSSSNFSKSSITLFDPRIKLKLSRSHFPTETVESIEKALTKVKILRKKININIEYSKSQWPPSMQSIIHSSIAKKSNCFFIGIEIDPFFLDPVTKKIFPLVLRKLHHELSKALKMGIFKFSHSQTTLRPTNYQALGRRAMVKAVWEVDQMLAEISNSFDFLLLVTPINIEQAWNRYRSHKFKVAPHFYYRPIPINPTKLKFKLLSIPIERIEDPTLASLFIEKQIELERTLSMLRDRGTRNFYFESLQLYGEVDSKLVDSASNVLNSISPHKYDHDPQIFYNAEMFYKKAENEIFHLKKQYPLLESKIVIRDDITGLMVSKGNLFIGSKLKVPESRVDALIQHEIGTHVLTYFNGKAQPFQQLYTGLAGYDELQEGIAVLSEYLVGGLSKSRLRLLAGRVMAAYSLVNGATFNETFNQLYKEFDFPQKISYIITARIYRGGGIVKDAVYFRGLLKILDFLQNGGELLSLLVGKISSEHIPIIKELNDRKILNPIPLKPRYFDDENAIKKLKHLKSNGSVLDLIKWR